MNNVTNVEVLGQSAQPVDIFGHAVMTQLAEGDNVCTKMVATYEKTLLTGFLTSLSWVPKLLGPFFAPLQLEVY